MFKTQLGQCVAKMFVTLLHLFNYNYQYVQDIVEGWGDATIAVGCTLHAHHTRGYGGTIALIIVTGKARPWMGSQGHRKR